MFLHVQSTTNIPTLILTLRYTLEYHDDSPMCGFWMTISMNSLSGAIMISLLRLRTRSMLNSSVGSKSRTRLDALVVSCDSIAACSAVCSSDRVVWSVAPADQETKKGSNAELEVSGFYRQSKGTNPKSQCNATRSPRHTGEVLLLSSRSRSPASPSLFMMITPSTPL